MTDEELMPQATPTDEGDLEAAAGAVARRAAAAVVDGRMPAVYLGHGAPPLVDAVQFGVSEMQPGMVVRMQGERFPRGWALRRERTLAR